ncbi:PREDICTED: centromere protein P-like [Miniopterus natalensis]|uniref:centromere protein P-like n=1 Tax=Miniopterus natalensis TaxID=291302 RepID=UPI0007A7084B|nr:PREDICTED: centromere protein P-like [Miniopterus natalensis]
MTERSIKKVLQRYKLSGNCHMITFQVEFQILEVQNKENLSSVITDLNIIMESTAYSELSEFVSRAEERRDLFMFFRSLHFFVEWCEYRKRTFKHFKVLLAPEQLTSFSPQIMDKYAGSYRCESPGMVVYLYIRMGHGKCEY